VNRRRRGSRWPGSPAGSVRGDAAARSDQSLEVTADHRWSRAAATFWNPTGHSPALASPPRSLELDLPEPARPPTDQRGGRGAGRAGEPHRHCRIACARGGCRVGSLHG
jgi:hypothetical protein